MPTAEDSRPEFIDNGHKDENLFSPRFRSVAAMAGWDEEALLLASLVVEDTPDRQLTQRKRSDLHSFKTPPTNSRRKRRAQRRSPTSKPVAILDLDEDESNPKQVERGRANKESNTTGKEAEKKERNDEEKKSVSTTTTTAIPCIDKLREELSCAICLEICYEPSTTPCGHSFCKKCLQSAADKCGKRCPKCRQLISNSRYCCIVNTVLWNTIQLLFPQDVKERKDAAAAAVDATSASDGSHHERTRHPARRNRTVAALNSPESERRNQDHHQQQHGHPVGRRRRLRPMRSESARSHQDEDAAMALRLQREEFMEAFNTTGGNHRSSSSSSSSWNNNNNNNSSNYRSSVMARANLRAMASRAINIRIQRPHYPSI